MWTTRRHFGGDTGFLIRCLEISPGPCPESSEGDETFILESFKGKRSGISACLRAREAARPAKCGISAEQIPVIVARDRHGATTDAVLPKLNRVSITAALGGVVTPSTNSAARWLRYCCLRPQGWKSRRTSYQRPANQTHKLPIFTSTTSMSYHSRLKEWMRRFHGVATKNLPTISAGVRTLEALGQQAHASCLILGAIGLGGHIQQITP